MASNKKMNDLEESILVTSLTTNLLVYMKILKEILKFCKKFRGSMEWKDTDIEKTKKRIKKIAARRVKLFYDDIRPRLLKEPWLLKEVKLLK